MATKGKQMKCYMVLSVEQVNKLAKKIRQSAGKQMLGINNVACGVINFELTDIVSSDGLIQASSNSLEVAYGAGKGKI